MTPEQIRAAAEVYAAEHIKYVGVTSESPVVTIDRIATHMEKYAPFVKAIEAAYRAGRRDVKTAVFGTVYGGNAPVRAAIDAELAAIREEKTREADRPAPAQGSV